MPNAFDVPRKTLGWARKEWEIFEQRAHAYFATEPYKQISWEEGPRLYFKAIPQHPVPEELEMGAYRIFGDLRNVLDQATHAASLMLGTDSPKKTNFPHAQSRANFEKSLTHDKGGSSGVPAEFRDVLRIYRPFYNGDDDVKGNKKIGFLCDAANPNKHRVPIGVTLKPIETVISEVCGGSFVNTHRWLPNDEFEIGYLHRTGGDYNVAVNLQYVIEVVDCPEEFKGWNVINVLEMMLLEVETIVAHMEGEVAKILVERESAGHAAPSN